MDYSNAIAQLPSTSLALLTSLLASHHLLVQVSPGDLHIAAKELESTASSALGMTCIIIELSPSTTLAQFTEAILVAESDKEEHSRFDGRRVANIVIAASLEKASLEVQHLALELMHTRRITGKDGVHLCPKNFCLVALCESLDGKWPAFKTKYLNDFFWVSHAYDTDYESQDDGPHDVPSYAAPDTGSKGSSNISLASVVRRPPGLLALLNETALESLRGKIKAVNATAEIRRYEHDIITFMRLHRAVAGGVSAVSARYLGILTKTLAVLNGIDFVTPSLVALGSRKVLAHRIKVATPDSERSMQWGSDREAVEVALRGVTADSIIDEILNTVPAPL